MHVHVLRALGAPWNALQLRGGISVLKVLWFQAYCRSLETFVVAWFQFWPEYHIDLLFDISKTCLSNLSANGQLESSISRQLHLWRPLLSCLCWSIWAFFLGLHSSFPMMSGRCLCFCDFVAVIYLYSHCSHVLTAHWNRIEALLGFCVLFRLCFVFQERRFRGISLRGGSRRLARDRNSLLVCWECSPC
jgi:hypothetical protein